MFDLALADSEMQDGDYSRVTVGSIQTFVLSFYGELSLTDLSVPKIVSMGELEQSYFVIAQVREITEQEWVMDCGFPVIGKRRYLPDDVIVGSFVMGEIGLACGSQYGTYRRKEYDSLKRRWQVRGITKKVAPMLTAIDATGAELYSRDDETRAVYEDIPSLDHEYTRHSEGVRAAEDAWRNGEDVAPFNTTYILHCQLKPVAEELLDRH